MLLYKLRNISRMKQRKSTTTRNGKRKEKKKQNLKIVGTRRFNLMELSALEVIADGVDGDGAQMVVIEMVTYTDVLVMNLQTEMTVRMRLKMVGMWLGWVGGWMELCRCNRLLLLMVDVMVLLLLQCHHVMMVETQMLLGCCWSCM